MRSRNQIQLVMQKQASELENSGARRDSEPSLSYCGINCFTISGQVKGYPITVEMQRQGFIDWQIVDVVLP